MAQDKINERIATRPLHLMRQVQNYQRIPFVDGGRDSTGVDCWGLVYLVYKQELDIELNSYGWISAEQLRAIVRQVKVDKDLPPWMQIQVGSERPYDVVVMTGTQRSEGRLITSELHVGVVVAPGMLMHTEEHTGVVCARFRNTSAGRASLLLANRVKSIHRYVGTDERPS